ncbi:hypothetical protein GGX14DRAFT_624755 [Mycena pura]|uniref:SWIM-type domain-containing protein n=1 Tax=Mycena pura TaxID=153505 RepID=A0AAD6VII3_9AGAR|nr:hypothetical protein GGX14DRAFT_624755 [Mycena pura]
MVLQKRNRDGEFEQWRPAGSSSSPPKASSLGAASDGSPPTKRPRHTVAHTPNAPSSSYPISTSSLLQAAPSSYYPEPSATGASVPASLPAKKSRRKAAGKSTEPPEKRLAVLKKKCPQNILDRVERVMTQRRRRFFMVDRKRFEGELKEEFQVLGSTGNVYTVTIQRVPSCDCPDARKGNHCKHILFVYLKVLQVDQSTGYWYQKALLSNELESIFAGAPLAPNALAHPRVRKAYERAIGKSKPASTPESSAPKKRLPTEDDDCAVCYEKMHTVAESTLAFCESCSNAVHGECFEQWKQTSRNKGAKVTCMYCRAEWPTAGGAGATADVAREAGTTYVNVASVANVSPQRDTSTYYHGPRRGQRYYY